MNVNDRTKRGTASIPEVVHRARLYFVERASAEDRDEWREAFEHMGHVAEAVEETVSLVEHLKIQVDEIRHPMRLHLEATGPVPHTRRGPRPGRPRPAPA